ncbi:MAG TPA: hypothetical protein VMR14_18850 [Streptosporangiaceae bacterium]|nr:hypothetical protein [Streptosporangiaceae bacterium]
MLLAWLLPEAGHSEAREGWTRSPYRPRHGKPSPIMRAGIAAMVGGAALARRCLGDEEDAGRARPAGQALARAGGVARPGPVMAPGTAVTWARR